MSCVLRNMWGVGPAEVGSSAVVVGRVSVHLTVSVLAVPSFRLSRRVWHCISEDIFRIRGQWSFRIRRSHAFSGHMSIIDLIRRLWTLESRKLACTPLRQGGSPMRVRSVQGDFPDTFRWLPHAVTRRSYAPESQNPRRVFLSALHRAPTRRWRRTGSPRVQKAKCPAASERRGEQRLGAGRARFRV